MQWCGSILCSYNVCSGVAAYAATPLHSIPGGNTEISLNNRMLNREP
jgi:hypothetical protein